MGKTAKRDRETEINMLLKELFAGLGSNKFSVPEAVAQHPFWTLEVIGLSTISQSSTPGVLFIGMPGSRVDGGDFWQSAIEKGAIAALITSQALENKPNTNSALVLTGENIPKTCAEVAAAIYRQPAKKMNMVGVTGTNGKTTTTHLI